MYSTEKWTEEKSNIIIENSKYLRNTLYLCIQWCCCCSPKTMHQDQHPVFLGFNDMQMKICAATPLDLWSKSVGPLFPTSKDPCTLQVYPPAEWAEPVVWENRRGARTLHLATCRSPSVLQSLQRAPVWCSCCNYQSFITEFAVISEIFSENIAKTCKFDISGKQCFLFQNAKNREIPMKTH